jgi:hypothetical protein
VIRFETRTGSELWLSFEHRIGRSSGPLTLLG